jgi:hypothetical protein
LFSLKEDYVDSPTIDIGLIITTTGPAHPYFIHHKARLAALNSLRGLLPAKVYGNQQHKERGYACHHHNKNIDQR